MEREISVTGVTSDENWAKVTLSGISTDVSVLYNVFSSLAAKKINVDMIVQAGTTTPTADLTFTVPREELDNSLACLAEIQGDQVWEILCDDNVAKVSIVGAGMMTNPGVAAKMFEALHEASIPVFVVSTSEIKVSCLIPRSCSQAAVQTCHEKFDLGVAN